MNKLVAGLAALLLSTAAAQAITLTAEFSGHTQFNPGLPGAGDFAGTIVYDTDGAIPVGGTYYSNVFSSVDLTVNGVGITSDTPVGPGSFNQVQLLTGQDAWLSNYSGPFLSTGEGYEPTNVGLEVRWNNGIDIFGDAHDLFSSLSDGDTFDLSDVNYLALNVFYDIGGVSGWTILHAGAFDTFNVSVSGGIPAVPLPAGAPLLFGGLAALSMVRRRKSRSQC